MAATCGERERDAPRSISVGPTLANVPDSPLVCSARIDCHPDGLDRKRHLRLLHKKRI